MSTGTGIALYGQIPDPIGFVKSAGTSIAESRMFGCKNTQQGEAIVLIAMSEGISFLEVQRRYHIMDDGKLVMRADYMRAQFRSLGGKFSWIATGDDGVKATARVVYKENDLEVSYSLEDAKREGLVRAASRWVKAPGDMLRARCATKAIRMVCPEVIAGFATDEELEASEPGAVASTPVAVAPVVVVDPITRQPPTPARKAEPVVDAEVEIVDARACTEQQRKLIEKLFNQLNVDETTRTGILKKFGVSVIRSLFKEQAEALIDKLVGKLNELETAMAAKSKLPFEATEAQVTGPCSQAQIDQIKGLVKEWAQVEPGADRRFIAALQAGGIGKIADLTHTDAVAMINAVSMRNLEAFFARSLTKNSSS